MDANSHGTAKRGEKRRLNRQRRRLYDWKASPSSFSWVSFLGCLQQCSILIIKTTYSREPWHCGVQREERIVHAFAWFRNCIHQNNAPCLIILFNKKYGRQRKLNYRYTSMPLVFSLAKKLNLLLKHRNRGTSRVGHVLSIQFGDNHVVWSEANYYYSWHLATKVIFNCIIQHINSWIKITRKITFIDLAVQ